MNEAIIPIPPHYFRMAELKGIDHDEKIIHLEIRSENVPSSICGDSCATNLKANRLVTEIYGISSPQADCSSHASSGTIRRTCTSKTMSDPDAVLLYTALRKILKHFSLSAKSTELLNNALDALEQHDVHMLVRGGTRMAGFLDGCNQASGILVPFIDTLDWWKNQKKRVPLSFHQKVSSPWNFSLTCIQCLQIHICMPLTVTKFWAVRCTTLLTKRLKN